MSKSAKDAIEALFVDAYRLEYIKRYSMKPVIHQESVASHSYFVALGVMMLHELYDFHLGVALQMAIVHDLPELSISDVNHKVKQRYPHLANAIRSAELEYVDTLPKVLKNAFKDHLRKQTPEALMVMFADAWQCGQYAYNELSLGNESMQEVYDTACKRMDSLESNMKAFER